MSFQEPIKLYIGWDHREAVGGHVFLQSLINLRKKTRVSVEFLTPEVAAGMGIGTDGTNAFSISRFAVPYMQEFKGWAIFMDGADMLLRADLAEIWALRDQWKAVQICQHDYKTKHPRKYIGTDLEADNLDYPMKNNSSVVLWNCGHFANQCLTPEYIREQGGKHLHRFEWIKKKEQIGSLPLDWNHLIGEQSHNPRAKVAHFTLGIAGFNHYADADYADEWKKALQDAMEGMQYQITYTGGR